MTTVPSIRRKDLIYPELSYQIVGALFAVYHELGSGYLERVYQEAVAHALTENGLVFREQVPVPVEFRGKKVGQYFLDFVIGEKVILELKQGNRFRRGNTDQVNAYLKSTGLQLAILANFTPEGVKFRRFVNIPSLS